MTKIVTFSGKKQAGKSTAGNALFGLKMWSILHPETNEPLIEYFRIDEKGRLIIPVDFGPEQGVQDGIFDPISREPAVRMFLEEFVSPVVKIYSFAESLKELCVAVLGLRPEQVYGTDEEKNSPSHIQWKNLPGFPKTKALEYFRKLGFDLKDDWSPEDYLTGRQVMQYVGTEIFRKMYNNVWVDATIRKIQAEAPEVAIITDCRFPNEVEGVLDAGGYVIRLTRAPFAGQDEHSSETQLDPDVFDWSKFSAILDNKDMSILEQNEALFKILQDLKIIEVEPVENA